jgi:site-specific DNA recombinase
MRVAQYARVSTTRQAQAQTIQQQLDRLHAFVQQQGWTVEDQHIYRDDGYSGATLNRPGLDLLRDQAQMAAFDHVVVTAPDRLARKYVHQMLLLEQWQAQGCQVEFLERPISQDPHDQLLLQIRGAVAEYERTLLSERMRRGRLAKLRAGQLLPWTRPLFGYRMDPQHPRDPTRLQVDPVQSVIVQELFAHYLQEQATLYQVARDLTQAGYPTPTGQPRWNVASVRGILKNPAYTGTAYANRTQSRASVQRHSGLQPVGAGRSHPPRPAEDWIPLSVPVLISTEIFEQVQAKLSLNQQRAKRNTQNDYLLQVLVSCGACHLSATTRQVHPGYTYYVCRGRNDPLRAAQEQRCTARYIPAAQLDALVWQDLCESVYGNHAGTSLRIITATIAHLIIASLLLGSNS